MHVRCFWGQSRTLALLTTCYVEGPPRCGSSEQAPLLCVCNWFVFALACLNPFALIGVLLWIIILLIFDIIEIILYFITLGWCCNCFWRGCEKGCYTRPFKEGFHIIPAIRAAGEGPWTTDKLRAMICMRDKKLHEWENCVFCHPPCHCWTQMRTISYRTDIEQRCDIRICNPIWCCGCIPFCTFKCSCCQWPEGGPSLGEDSIYNKNRKKKGAAECEEVQNIDLMS